MSTFINQPSVPLSTSQSSTGGLSLSASSSAIKTSLNPGTIATVIAISSQQLTLGNANGRVTVNAPTIPQNLQQGKEVSFKVNTEKSTNLLEVSAKYAQQKLPLTQQQSQQVLQTVLQNPANISGRLEVSGQVVAVQKSQIHVSVGGQTVTLNVRNPQQYQTGQTVKLELSSGSLGWELDIRQDKKQENIRLPATEAQKIITGTRPGTPINISQTGTKQLQPILQQASDSVIPDKTLKISLNNVDGKFVANVQLSSKPLASISLDNHTTSKLSSLDNSVQKGANAGNIVNQEIQKNIAGHENQNIPGARTVSTQSKTTAQGHVTYQNPIINSKAATDNVSPDIEKTIKASQNQFTDLKVTPTSAEQSEKTISPNRTSEPVKEIKMTQIKASREENLTQMADTFSVQKSASSQTLSPAAQSIMSTVNSLAKVDIQDIKSQVMQRLTSLIHSMPTSTAGEANTRTAEAVLKAISQLSTQTSSANIHSQNKETLTALSAALAEINASNEIASEVKSFVRENGSHVKTDPLSGAVQTPDASKVKQLLQSPTLPVTPISIISPPQTGGMINGLVNLLQVALTARLNKTNQQASEQLNQVLTNIVAGNNKSLSGKGSGASLRDLSHIEQKHNLVKVLGDMLNQHTNQKVQNAERQLQGQEAFYFVLPFGSQEQQNPAELLISKDKPDQENEQDDKTQNSVWSLTIKLSVGELGEILTKSKVAEDEINIDFYASNENLKNLIFNYSPVLKKRFDELGLNLQIGRVERGNIPQQLAKNPYQILETRV